MNPERVRIQIPYVADVVPRQARKGRPTVFRTEIAADIPTASRSDLGEAVVVDSPYGRRVWHGHAGRLWLPVEEAAGRAANVEGLFRALASGEDFPGIAANPFLRLGSRPAAPEEFRTSRPVEEMALRSIARDDRTENEGRAARISRDFLLLDDGTLMGRSSGPSWVVKIAMAGIAPTQPFVRSGRGEASHASFGILRYGDAAAYAGFVGVEDPHPVDGPIAVAVPMPECIEDHDALVCARLIASLNLLQFARGLEATHPAFAELMKPTFDVVGRLYGRDADLFGRDGSVEACPGAPSATPQDVLDVVDGIRFLVAEAPSRRDTLGSLLQRLADAEIGPHLDRFDLFEYARLGIGQPDIASPMDGPTP